MPGNKLQIMQKYIFTFDNTNSAVARNTVLKFHQLHEKSINHDKSKQHEQTTNHQLTKQDKERK